MAVIERRVEWHAPRELRSTALLEQMEDWPRWTFIGVEVFAFAYYLHAARRSWFGHDILDFLAGRNLSDAFQQAAGHCIALPTVVFRLMFWAIGLRSAAPYQLMTIGLHLGAAALLRVVMLRSGVRPWIATALAGAFACFGSGVGDILATFQTVFDGALVLGLAQLLLADHDGFDRRDGLGLLCGLLALTCSNVGVAAVAAVGVAALIRRGWRAAAFHTIPLAVLYSIWWATQTHAKVSSGGLADWMRVGIAGVFDALGQVPSIGWFLGALLIVGLGLGLVDRRAAMPIGLLCGGFTFLLTAGMARVAYEGAAGATTSRYLHIVAAMLVPALGFAANAVADKGWEFGVVAVALVLIGVPGNLAKTDDFLLQPHTAEYRKLVLSLPRLPLAREVPRSVRPFFLLPHVTVGWMLDGVSSGRFPQPPHMTPAELANVQAILTRASRAQDGK